MTPTDIATRIDSLDTLPGGNVNWSTSATYCWNGSQAQCPDDQRSWD